MRNQRGITLVALVITIIVLLILAAVTIAALGGSNGILTNASNAQIQNQLGEAKDLVNLAVNEGISSYYKSTYAEGHAENEALTSPAINNTAVSHIVTAIDTMNTQIGKTGVTLLYVTPGTEGAVVLNKDVPSDLSTVTGIQIVSENQKAGVKVSITSSGLGNDGWADLSSEELATAVAEINDNA